MSDHHILVIDDDERLRLLLRRFLEESGFRVTDVGSTAEARGILAGLAFDLLIIDIMMPGETGLEFLQELRKSNPVPALFLTALSETEHRIQGLEFGADDYMSKPFEPRELVLRIKSILAGPQTLRQVRINRASPSAPIYTTFIPACLRAAVDACISPQQSRNCLAVLPRARMRCCPVTIWHWRWKAACRDGQLMLLSPDCAASWSRTRAIRSICRRCATEAGCCGQTSPAMASGSDNAAS